MKYGSLFTGIGGLDLGFDENGMECAWQVEEDKYCLSVLNRYWPDVPKYKDVKDVGKENLEPVDLICGGFPCQDISIAGNRKGLAGERSGLWFEFLRVITELKPTWIVIENVPGLLSSNKGRDFAIILRGLEKCGYWWAYRILDSQYFGVPQSRRRVFIVGCLARGFPQKVLFEPESSPWATPPSREMGQKIAGTLAQHTRGYFPNLNYNPLVGVRRLTPLECERLQGFPDCWTKYGLSEDGETIAISDTQRYGQLGNAVTVSVARWLGKRIVESC